MMGRLGILIDDGLGVGVRFFIWALCRTGRAKALVGACRWVHLLGGVALGQKLREARLGLQLCLDGHFMYLIVTNEDDYNVLL